MRVCIVEFGMASKPKKRGDPSQLLDPKENPIGLVTDEQLILVDRDFILSCKSVLRDKLTESEKRVCSGLFLGLSAKEIAKLRGISHRTVENHIANIRRKNNGNPLSAFVLAVIFLQLKS